MSNIAMEIANKVEAKVKKDNELKEEKTQERNIYDHPHDKASILEGYDLKKNKNENEIDLYPLTKPIGNITPIYNVNKWIEKNKESFKPPICNKLMYGNQLKVMFVGSPNVRKDYHIDCGEEFFYQLKGNISLPTYQCGKKKIVNINEGDVFLLKSRIPHSPQRPNKDSVGLVIERERIEKNGEIDALRYYTCDFDKNAKEGEILWEKWFYCSDLGKQLGPVVKEFMSSEESKTGKPTGKNITKDPPVILDTLTKCDDPFNLEKWLNKKSKKLKNEKILDLFNGTQTNVKIMVGKFEYRAYEKCETWIYILNGNNIELTFHENNDRKDILLNKNDCIIIRKYEQFKLILTNIDDKIMTVNMRDDIFSGSGKVNHSDNIDDIDNLENKNDEKKEDIKIDKK